MTVDVNESLFLYWGLVSFVTSITKLVVILIILHYKIGKAIYLGLYILLGSFVVNIILTSINFYLYGKEYEKKDVRVCISKDVIEGIKSIKYLGWEEIFEKKIMQIRG